MGVMVYRTSRKTCLASPSPAFDSEMVFSTFRDEGGGAGVL
jgi:hypothetical protein